MLWNIHVKNMALIQEVDVELSTGLNILTGETGAGKSIIIGAVNVALGCALELVGEENIYTFGRHSDEVIRMYAGEGDRAPDGRSYHPLEFYHRPGVEPLVDFIVSPELLSIGDPVELSALWKDMKSKDWFMAQARRSP